MSQIKKLTEKLQSNPKDFEYSELCRIMAYFGYSESTGGKTSGSAMKFIDANSNTLYLHKRHPKSVLLPYQVTAVIDHLKERDLL